MVSPSKLSPLLLLTFTTIVLESSQKMIVVAPEKLKEQITNEDTQEIDHVISLYGDLDFKKSELYTVIALDSSNYDGCDDFNIADEVAKEKDFKVAVIVQQGRCADHLKASNAVKSGVDMIINYLSFSKDKLANHRSKDNTKLDNPHVTVVTVEMAAGEYIIEALERQDKIIIRMDLDIPYKMEVPLVNIWMNPLSRQSYNFLLNFKNYEKQFGNTINFFPIMRFKNANKANSGTTIPTFTKKYLRTHCYDYGYHCSDGSFENREIKEPTTVLDEGIRQTCIFEKDKEQFYRYAAQYSLICLDDAQTDEDFELDKCTHALRFKLFNTTFTNHIEDCYKQSFVIQSKRYRSPNKILSKYSFLYAKDANPRIPTFLIGTFGIRVSLNFLN